MSKSKDNIAASMRVCLIGREKEIQHLLDVGIEDVDWHYNASECFVLLNSIDESLRTIDEKKQLQQLLKILDVYEIKHYGYGN